MINIFLLLYDIMWSKLKLLILYKIVGCWNHVILLDQQWSKKSKGWYVISIYHPTKIYSSSWCNFN